MNVLIVEDDPVTSLILRIHLVECGYDVTVCGTAEEAMKVFRETAYPLMFIDLNLPGMRLYGPKALKFCFNQSSTCRRRSRSSTKC
jgi:DNA-binding response OmpR family regulator